MANGINMIGPVNFLGQTASIIIYIVNSVVVVCIVPSDGLYKLLPHILSSSGNLALSKHTQQLQSQSVGQPSSLAVDGITKPSSGDKNCAHPFSGQHGNPPVPVWWYVDLGLSYRITQSCTLQQGE